MLSTLELSMKAIDFQSQCSYNICIKKTIKDLIIVVYVDDTIIARNNLEFVATFN
jgi:hypothetical protein